MSRVKLPLHPRLREVELEPIGPAEKRCYLLWDPSEWGKPLVLPQSETLLAALMNGKRTLAKIQEAFRQRTGRAAGRRDVERLVRRLERARLLASAAFRRYFHREIRKYYRSPVRPAAHAGEAYPDRPLSLRRRITRLFSEHVQNAAIENERPSARRPTRPSARRRPTGRNHLADGRPTATLVGVLVPHIDPLRGGLTYAAAYHPLRRHGAADLFVIFGTAHTPLKEWFSATRKDFATPLGRVRTDQAFLDRLQKHLAATVLGRQMDIFADELAHRREHSLEFQVVFLQYLFGRQRAFRIVPILAGSFRELIAEGETPEDSIEVHTFATALRGALAEQPGRVCCLSSADLAHIGPRFGDPRKVNEKRLRQQADEDQELLKRLCRGDRRGFFRHVARHNDRNRICGLAPTYLMLRVLEPVRGELLRYEQAVEPDGSACVTYAAAAFYR